jgi:hypothetical protein
MTCNVARPYSADLKKAAFKVFSRVRADMIFQKGDRIEISAFPENRPLICTWQLSRNLVAKPFLQGGHSTTNHNGRKLICAGKR